MTTTTPRPGHRSIRLAPDGAAWIEGYRCDACSAVVPDATLACRACASRTVPHGFRSPETGKLYSWSVVHRSYPGIVVPFVSAIVDLDGGLTLKGTLQGVSDGDLRAGMPVRLVFDDAGGARDGDGAPYVGFHFGAEGSTV
ncbi:MAG: hypothetical protein RL367_240 [Pseudomonadota bacterium]|jgi:uncharacterized OB-fold protein